jgi:alpha-N-arabinofuranosidase
MRKSILRPTAWSIAILVGQLGFSAARANEAPAAAPIPVISIKADQVAAKVSPTLYGLMTEEINYSYEGGLYGELIRNRTFKADPATPLFWNPVGPASLTLDPTEPLNDALNLSLKVDANRAAPNSPAGISNEGYWGIPVRSATAYRVSFYAKAADGFSGGLRAELKSGDGKTTFGDVEIPHLTGAWKKYDATLRVEKGASSQDNQFALTTTSPGTFWLQQVSLFPPTYHDRPNGNRPDLMKILADMKPQFLRFPGGNYLEGDTIAQRFDWKKTIGDAAQRPGHESPWGYWSTDGLGLLEFLEWCEDLHMQPVLAVYAGYSLKQDRVAAGPDLQPYVQDALDEIEYVTGDVSTPWGARRAKDGHPAPFALTYVEIGNEDFFDKAKTYDARFAQFYDAIKAKHPNLQLISTVDFGRPADPVKSRTPDLVDEHLYPGSEGQMEARAHEFDHRSRTGPKIFVGEWATRIGGPTTDMTAALADAAWMTGMERNSDLVVMQCYAPLLVNVSHPIAGRGPDSSMQWPSDLIGYDAMSSYGSPSYYAQKMFSTHHGDVVLATAAQNIPTWTWQPPARGHRGVATPAPPPQQVPALFFDATRDSRSGTIFVKIVNRNSTPQPVMFIIGGVSSVARNGESLVLKASNGAETNTLQNPVNIVPVPQPLDGLSADFTRDVPPCSISILEIDAK